VRGDPGKHSLVAFVEPLLARLEHQLIHRCCNCPGKCDKALTAPPLVRLRRRAHDYDGRQVKPGDRLGQQQTRFGPSLTKCS